jgi:hypothetical protein
VGINKCGEPRTLAVTLNAHPLRSPGRFRDALSDHMLAVNGEWIAVELPPRSARLWRFDAEASGCGSRRLRDKIRQRCTQGGMDGGESRESPAPRDGRTPNDRPRATLD